VREYDVQKNGSSVRRNPVEGYCSTYITATSTAKDTVDRQSPLSSRCCCLFRNKKRAKVKGTIGRQSKSSHIFQHKTQNNHHID
jgi:hypothetical protein